ncbi:ATP-binding protein [Patulibacter defluvii]|uniref:ATP-binding protein n=1 Tax=Patulibacter defluvii TaxID=3095358 RepID=UPI002A75EC59|nr:ATP-binding protein [Patulibacter sp. DM4]
MRCPYDICDGSGWIVDDRARTATECRCMPEQRARRVAGSLRARIGKKYRDVAFDRPPVSSMDRTVIGIVREYVADLPARLGRGEGLWLTGGTGNGKTTLATLISKHAIEAGHTVAIYSLPRLLSEIRRTYDADGGPRTLELLDALTRVDLLQIDDVGAEQSTPWVLEQLYSIVNARYEEEKAVTITTNLDPMALRDQVGERTVSRLEEMCRVVAIPDEVDHRQAMPGPRLGVAGHAVPSSPPDGGLGPAPPFPGHLDHDHEPPPRPAVPPTWGLDPAGAHRPVRRGRDDR